MPVILLPGMGADNEVFSRQMEEIPGVVIPGWLAPRESESLPAYAARLAVAVDPGRPCYIGGASFGGFVALEMIPHLDVRGCILVGSVRSSRELPGALRVLRPAARAARVLPFEILQAVGRILFASVHPDAGSDVAVLLDQMSRSDAAFLRWACRAVIEWDGPAEPAGAPIHQIHGAADRILPPSRTRPDCIVPGAGHALSVSHPEEVTRFLRKVLAASEPET
ncbi:MAG: alpha/beta hydrolase [Verrucomicrobia bacterium]|nr:alpha/beta hydrolase [Verrucomicrobiota bacterium]